MHFHVGTFEFLKFFMMLLIAGFLIRTIEISWPQSKISQALAYIY